MHFETVNYINSGHLITSAKLFKNLNGFNEKLVTSEDYDFSHRAKNIGAKIINNCKLAVEHLGYPEDIRSFIMRERWHGREDFKCLKNILNSKEAIFVISHILLISICLLISIIKLKLIFVLAYPLIIIPIVIIMAFFKFDRKFSLSIFITSVILYLYLIGRSFALMDIIRSSTNNLHK